MDISEIAAVLGRLGGQAGKGKKRPSSSANMAKARAAVSPERRSEILAKARAAKKTKKYAKNMQKNVESDL